VERAWATVVPDNSAPPPGAVYPLSATGTAQAVQKSVIWPEVSSQSLMLANQVALADQAEDRSHSSQLTVDSGCDPDGEPRSDESSHLNC